MISELIAKKAAFNGFSKKKVEPKVCVFRMFKLFPLHRFSAKTHAWNPQCLSELGTMRLLTYGAEKICTWGALHVKTVSRPRLHAATTIIMRILTYFSPNQSWIWYQLGNIYPSVTSVIVNLIIELFQVTFNCSAKTCFKYGPMTMLE